MSQASVCSTVSHNVPGPETEEYSSLGQKVRSGYNSSTSPEMWWAETETLVPPRATTVAESEFNIALETGCHTAHSSRLPTRRRVEKQINKMLRYVNAGVKNIWINPQMANSKSIPG